MIKKKSYISCDVMKMASQVSKFIVDSENLMWLNGTVRKKVYYKNWFYIMGLNIIFHVFHDEKYYFIP